MVRTAVATLQTAWDCKWSRPGFRVAGVPEQLQREGLWVCIRTGERRSVNESECENCMHWEMDDLRRN
jgi:hypothetical protein